MLDQRKGVRKCVRSPNAAARAEARPHAHCSRQAARSQGMHRTGPGHGTQSTMIWAMVPSARLLVRARSRGHARTLARNARCPHPRARCPKNLKHLPLLAWKCTRESSLRRGLHCAACEEFVRSGVDTFCSQRGCKESVERALSQEAQASENRHSFGTYHCLRCCLSM